VPTPPVSREIAEEAVAALDAARGNQTNAARALGVARSTFQNRLKTAARYGLMGPIKAREGFSIVQITERLPDGTSVTTKPEFDEPTAPEGMTENGRSVYVPGKGWFKYGKEASNEDLVARMEAAFANYTPHPTPAPSRTRPDLVSVYPLVDFHVGLLAWENETGESYDTNIARETILDAMSNLVQSTLPSKKAVVLGLGDLLHFDGFEAKTERSGNALDTDSRYPKVLEVATEIVMQVIEMALANHDEVDIRIMQGNHDNRAAIAVSLALRFAYKNHPRVLVDSSPAYQWYKRYGKVLLGATHGDKTKMDQMPLLMAVDRPEDWAASTRRRVFTGHIHHERLKEIGGVIVESLRSPVAKDAYHSFAGYRAGRSVYSYTFWTDGSRMAKMEFEL
jgi:hypothetical protein